MHIIPNTIHFIWLGSFLKQEHQERIKEWRFQNPEYSLRIWICKTIISKSVYTQFHDFCKKNNLLLQDVSELDDLSSNVHQWLQCSLTHKTPNYGALSDIYRFYILRSGGWYFDTDVMPKKPLPLNLSTTYGFLLNASSYESNGVAVYPDQIAVSPTSHFTHMSIQVIEALIAMNAGDGSLLFEVVHDLDPIRCWMGTVGTTGLIAFGASVKLLTPENQVMIRVNSRSFIEPSIIFEHIIGHNIYFETKKGGELSWIAARHPTCHRLTSNARLHELTQEFFYMALRLVREEPACVNGFFHSAISNELNKKEPSRLKKTQDDEVDQELLEYVRPYMELSMFRTTVHKKLSEFSQSAQESGCFIM